MKWGSGLKVVWVKGMEGRIEFWVGENRREGWELVGIIMVVWDRGVVEEMGMVFVWDGVGEGIERIMGNVILERMG